MEPPGYQEYRAMKCHRELRDAKQHAAHLAYERERAELVAIIDPRAAELVRVTTIEINYLRTYIEVLESEVGR